MAIGQTSGVQSLSVCLTTEQLRRPVPGGIATYVGGLTKALQQISNVQLTTWDGSPWQIKLVNQFGSTAGFVGKSTDVLHGSSWIVPPFSRRKTTSVFVHDLLWRSNPEWFTPRGVAWHERRLAEALRRADTLFVPSRAVSHAVLDLGVGPDRVVVTGEGCDHVATAIDNGSGELTSIERAQLDALGSAFLLFVGTNEPRKNLGRVVEAFGGLERARSLDAECQLVIVGPDGWGGDRPRAADSGNVQMLGRVSDAMLVELYARATGLIYPSLGEGFGLPVAEAMHRGLAVVTTLSVPVVAEYPNPTEIAYLADPRDVESIAQAIRRLFEGGQLRQSIVDAAQSFVSTLTWSHSAARHVDAWQKALG